MLIDRDGRIKLEFKPGVLEEIWKELTEIILNDKIEKLTRKTEVSSFGRVRVNGSISPIYYNADGYPIINIWILRNGMEFRVKGRVYRLAAMAYIPNDENKKEINHKNYRKSDSVYTNLEWSTRSENMRHAYEQRSALDTKIGQNNGRAKLTNEQVHEICRLLELGCKDREIIWRCDFLDDMDIRLIYRIRIGEVWDSIARDYTFIKKTCTILTDADVRLIRKLKARGHTSLYIEEAVPNLKKYTNVATIINGIINGKTYKHVK